MAPLSADGTAQFKDGTANIGAPVPVSGGFAFHLIDSQIQVPGSKMMTLGEVFDVVKRARATGKRGVMLNIETKVEAGAPEQTAPREQFVQVAVQEIRRAGMLGNVTIQSFDWGALMRMRQVEPRLPIVALTNGTFLQVGQPGASP